MKLYYFNTLKALWDGQGKIKMYYWMSRFKKQLSGKRHIVINLSTLDEVAWHWWRNPLNRKFVGTIIGKNSHSECKLIRINIKIRSALNSFLVLQFKNFCYLSISNTINCFIEPRHSVLSGRSGIKFKLTEKGQRKPLGNDKVIICPRKKSGCRLKCWRVCFSTESVSV